MPMTIIQTPPIQLPAPTSLNDPWVEPNFGALSPYYGDPTAAAVVYGTIPAISAAYQDPSIISPNADMNIDMALFDTLLVLLDLFLNTATDVRIQAYFDSSLINIPLVMRQPTQETRVDDGTASQRKWQAIEHVFAATGRYLFTIPRQSRYCKLRFKTTGGPGTTTIALAVQPQRRLHY